MTIKGFFLLLLLVSQNAFAGEIPMFWGKTGHRVVGEIAQHHLTKKAQNAIKKLLNGQSLAMVSTYADEIKSDKRFKKYDPWHYVNFSLDKAYGEETVNPDGDVIQAIDICINVLKNPNETQANKSFYLKLLVHFIGDLHQPMHLGLAEDKGGNNFQVQWFGRGSNMHRVWDSGLIDNFGMSYTEMAKNMPSLSQVQKKYIMNSSLTDWVKEIRKHTIDIYGSAKSGEKLGYEYAYQYNDLVLAQLQKAGLRLAATLNQIFG